jgi:hypothetical protein
MDIYNNNYIGRLLCFNIVNYIELFSCSVIVAFMPNLYSEKHRWRVGMEKEKQIRLMMSIITTEK